MSKSDLFTSRPKRRKKLKLYLLDDDHNSFEYVISVLGQIVPGYNSLRAEQAAVIAHNKGRCELITTFPPDIYIIQAALIQNGLLVQLTTKK